MDYDSLTMVRTELLKTIDEVFTTPINMAAFIDCFYRTSAYNREAREYNDSKPAVPMQFLLSSSRYTLFYAKNSGEVGRKLIKRVIKRDPSFLAPEINGQENIMYHSFAPLARLLDNDAFDRDFL